MTTTLDLIKRLADELEADDRAAWRYMRKEHAGNYEPRESVKLARAFCDGAVEIPSAIDVYLDPQWQKLPWGFSLSTLSVENPRMTFSVYQDGSCEATPHAATIIVRPKGAG